MRAGRLFLVFCLLVLKAHALNLYSHYLPFETGIDAFFRPIDTVLKDPSFERVDCLYVINLDARPEKWALTQERLSPYNVTLNRFSAINGWTMGEDELERLWKSQNREPWAKKGKVGCILSHLSVLQDAYDRGFECIWVLQDDIEVFRDPHLIDDYIKKLNTIDPNWSLLYTDLDMRVYQNPNELLRFMSIEGAYRENQQTMPPSWYLIRKNLDNDFQKIHSRYGFHSVLVSRRGMKQILDYFKHVTIHTHFDNDIHFIPDLRQYGLLEAIISNSCDWKISDSDRPFLDLKNLPAPYAELKEILPFTNHKKRSDEKSLFSLIKAHKAKTVLELSSSNTESKYPVAKALPSDGKFLTLLDDTTEKAQFLSNIVQDLLAPRVLPLKEPELLDYLNLSEHAVDLLYLSKFDDVQAAYEALCRWEGFVRKGGIVCVRSPKRNNSAYYAIKRFAKERAFKIQGYDRDLWAIRIK